MFLSENYTIVYRFLVLLYSLLLSLNVYSQGSAKILEYNTSVRIENNKLIEEKTLCIKVEDRQADWLSDIRIPYSKSSRIDILDAYVMNSRGITVRKLLKKEIITLSDISENAFYEDDMAKVFSLRSNEYPYFIVYSFRKISDKFIYLASWTPHYLSGIGIEKSSLQVELPLNFKVRIHSAGDIKFRKDSTESKFVYTWEASDVAPVKKEIMTPPVRELLSYVMVIPENFIYGIPGKLDSWKSLGLWHEKINRDMDLLPLSEQIRVTTLLNGVTERHEKMKKLYYYMQDNTHYVNVSIDIGGLQPYPASYVCSNKYGDCKALTMYMKALLKFVGIESFYTIIYAGINPVRINKDIPAFQFNHVILCIPDENDTIWLENTSQEVPFGYLGSSTQNRYALVVNGEQSRLVRTPVMDPSDFLVKSSYLINPGFSGKSLVHMEKEFRGNDFVKWIHITSEYTEKEIREELGNALQFRNELVKYEILPRNREQQSVVIVADLKANDIMREIGNNSVLSQLPVELLPFEKPEERKYPVRIVYPVNTIDTMEYDLTRLKDYNIAIPENISIITRYGSFKTEFHKTENKVTILRSFFMPVGDYPLEDYKSFYAFIETVKKSVKTLVIILTPKT